MNERDFKLFNWKEEDNGKQTTEDFYSEPPNDTKLKNRLRVNDCVQLMLIDKDFNGRVCISK